LKKPPSMCRRRFNCTGLRPERLFHPPCAPRSFY
jgi:hypothetical protein